MWTRPRSSQQSSRGRCARRPFVGFFTFGQIVQIVKCVRVGHICHCVPPAKVVVWMAGPAGKLVLPYIHFCRGHTVAHVTHTHTLGHLYYWPKSGETDKSEKNVCITRPVCVCDCGPPAQVGGWMGWGGAHRHTLLQMAQWGAVTLPNDFFPLLSVSSLLGQ